ncbi:MAG TPA: RHS repeat-associated core domain-containing protein, partial [Thermoanaerobaculia bacterium]
YWPYGEDTNTTAPNQHLGFHQMERNDGVAQHFDHARTHQDNIGRFLSTDAFGGHPTSPQSWNRYAYTLGNPLKHVDPNGLLTIVVHGTQFSKPNADFTPAGAFFQRVARTFGDRTTAAFSWSGGDNHPSRVAAAQSLASFIRHYNFSPGEPLNIVAHSHGGNVAIAAINMGLGRTVDNLVTLGTPSVPSYRLQGSGGVSRWLNVSNPNDKVQTHGGGDDGAPAQTGAAARTHPFAQNLSLDVDFGPFGSHEWLHSADAWERITPYLTISPQNLERMFMWVSQ